MSKNGFIAVVKRANTQTYSFHLRAIKEGNFTMPQASITVDKKRITSEPCEINVVASSNGNTYRSGNDNVINSSQTTSSSKEIFMEAIPSKRKAYIGAIIRIWIHTLGFFLRRGSMLKLVFTLIKLCRTEAIRVRWS